MPESIRRIPIQFINPARGTVRVANTKTQRSTMRIEIVQGGHVLRQYNYNGQSYIEAPPAGDYQIRLTNQSPQRKLVVLSVDGVNVVDGETAGYEGPGYVLAGWQTANIKGWRRTDAEVAAFAFNASSQSYANKTGRGTKNTGVIGIAVYDEKPKPVPSWARSVTTTTTTETFGEPISSRGYTGLGSTMDSMDLERDSGLDDEDDGISQVFCASAAPAAESADLGTSYSASAGTLNTKGLQPETAKAQSVGDRLSFNPESARGGVMRRRRVTKGAPSLGTGYGKQTAMHTSTTEFERASEQPSLVVVLRYAVAAKLKEWGVPVIERSPSADAFPASSGPSVAAPPGWRG
jgi:hypothetical protein